MSSIVMRGVVAEPIWGQGEQGVVPADVLDATHEPTWGQGDRVSTLVRTMARPARPVTRSRPVRSVTVPGTLRGVDAARQTRAVVRPGSSRMRLTLRGKVVALGLVLAVVATPALLGTRSAQAESPQSAPEVVRHVVLPGETLWQIAQTVVEPGEDIRDVVHDLAVLNDLPDSSLMAGQTIVVPVAR
jgi:hypothetical protein